MTASSTGETVAAAAAAYHARGWKPVPVNRKTKKPIGSGWQKRPFDPAQFNGNAENVAIQFGADSGGLTDVDLDCNDAIFLAQHFLPPTDAIFGRRSKPCSHMLYVTDLHKIERRAAIQFKEHTDGRQGPVIVEVRIGADSKGAATVFPPSMHSAGELVQWEREGEPARVGGTDLKHAVFKLAVACLLKQHYPGQGSRQEGALVIGGVLARAGWSTNEIEHLIEVVASAVGDDEVPKRVNAATNAVDLKANGKNVAGLARCREVWGQDVADTLGKWLGGSAVRQAKGAGLEDSIALDFAERHADDYRYIAASSQWMRWAETRWQTEDTLAAFDDSRKLCRQAGDAKAKTVAAVTALARSDRRMAATADQWDSNPMLFNAARSTIDLATCEERPPDRADYITKQAGTWVAQTGTPHPLWTGFLDRVTNADEHLIGFLQRLAGYCLTGLTREHMLAFLYGPGANGKGVFVNTTARIMGAYAISAPMEMFLASKLDRHPTEIARLKGARLVVAQETTKGRRWDETKLKNLTSSDPLSGHFMRQDYFDFYPTHKLLITGNHKPSLSSINEAIRRRLLLVPFTVEIPPEERDPDFAAKLVPEHPAILRWMVDGCLEWQRDGLNVPGCVREASDAYFADQDTLQQWIDDWIDARDPRAFTPTRQLFGSWKGWAEQRNMQAGTERAFAQSLAEKGYHPHRTPSARGFNGIRLKPHDGEMTHDAS
jgi:P4 family phage/plasmid primase-like protien